MKNPIFDPHLYKVFSAFSGRVKPEVVMRLHKQGKSSKRDIAHATFNSMRGVNQPLKDLEEKGLIQSKEYGGMKAYWLVDELLIDILDTVAWYMQEEEAK